MTHAERVELGRRLRIQRAGRKLSQNEVERRAHLSRGKYWRIENGYDEPTPAELKAIARTLHTTAEDLQSTPEVA